ncbi:MAG TPA: tetratricopeptide repeat protein [Vicinamibacterales bacterium]|nr:tetratricopeptide repeat protein [Vicinamibacterales bacterium]
MLAVVAALLALGAVGGTLWRERPLALRPAASRADVSAHRALLLVRPFEDLSARPGQAYVSEGFTEDLIAQVGQMYPQGLGVIARTTAMASARTPATVGQIGHELGVGYVLEGSVRLNGPRALVTAQLVQVLGGRTLWSDRFERDRTDLAAMQRHIAQEVARVLAVALRPRRNVALVRVATGSGPAYDACLRGRDDLRRATVADLARAADAFREATREDPDYARAWVGLAETHLAQRSELLTAPGTALDQAERAARRAATLDPSLAEAHAALGEVLHLRDAHDRTAETELRRAIALNPSDVLARDRYACLLLDAGRTDQALDEIARAIVLDPRSPSLLAARGWILYRAGDDDGAAAAFQAALAIDPSLPFAHYGLGRIDERHARFDEAVAHFEQARDASHGAARYLGALGDVYAKTGQVAPAHAVLRALQALAMTRYVAPGDIRDLANEIGRAEALAAAQRAARPSGR